MKACTALAAVLSTMQGKGSVSPKRWGGGGGGGGIIGKTASDHPVSEVHSAVNGECLKMKMME